MPAFRGEALRRTYLRTGAAVSALRVHRDCRVRGPCDCRPAGLDEIGLISVAPVLRDFGLITVADLAVALAGVMLVLPAVVVWAEEGQIPSAREVVPLPAGAGGRSSGLAHPRRRSRTIDPVESGGRPGAGGSDPRGAPTKHDLLC